MSLYFPLLAVLQIGVSALPASPHVRYQFVTSPEGNSPVAICDTQFSCHCPVGYKAVIQQSPSSTEAVSVVCEHAAVSNSMQPRETYDSYPVLPAHENLGR